MKISFRHNFKNFLGAFLFAAAMGVIIGYQFNIQKRIHIIQNSNEEENLAVEVASLIKANEAYSKQLDELSLQRNKLEFDVSNSSNNLANLESDIARYRILLGKAKVEGEGVIISINDSMVQTQLVDMINALRNIGYEALAINDKRLMANSGISSGMGSPIIIKVIGDKKLLNDSLKRAGGILEQTEISASIATSDKITIN